MRAPSQPESLATEARRAMQDRGTLLVMTDYDGTLTPIVSRPEDAYLAPTVRETLAALAQKPGVGVAVISGRSLPDVRERVDLAPVVYAGCHGLMIEGPSLGFVHPEAIPAKTLIAEVGADLSERLQGLNGVEVETKEFCVSVHYRRALPSDLAEVFFQVERVREHHASRLVTQPGKKVIELLPRVNWDKGECALWLRDHWIRDPASREPAIVYLGDDETDERAFEALRGKALTVRVGSGPRRSAALRWVEDVSAVHRFLTTLESGASSTNGAHG
jgi:trehalose-phosphatase